jgi:DNA-binding transcriptional ArsR family regulator
MGGVKWPLCSPCAMPNETELDSHALDRIASFFKVFAEPTRLAILQLLRRGPASVNDIVASLSTSQANVSKQLKTLHAADLLKREPRGTQVIYSISEPLVFELCDLVCSKLNRRARAEATVVYEI